MRILPRAFSVLGFVERAPSGERLDDFQRSKTLRKTNATNFRRDDSGGGMRGWEGREKDNAAERGLTKPFTSRLL